jgi:hypothetical protein
MAIKKSSFIFLFILILVVPAAYAQENTSKKKIKQVAEVSCGQCNFNLKSAKGCCLAVRINDKAYFIDGANIDDFGDAHAQDGFCNSIRKAAIKGKIIAGRFKVKSFKLLKEE